MFMLNFAGFMLKFAQISIQFYFFLNMTLTTKMSSFSSNTSECSYLESTFLTFLIPYPWVVLSCLVETISLFFSFFS